MGKIFINTIEEQNKTEKKHIVRIEREKDSNYIVVDDVYLRLRLDNHIERSKIKLSSCQCGTSVDLGCGLIVANARTNMNPFIVSAKMERELGLYVIVNSGHKILYTELDEGTIIKNTFKTPDKNTGAIMSFKPDQKKIATIYTESNSKVYRFEYSFSNGSVTMKVKQVKDLATIAEINEKGKFTFNKFKITIEHPFTDHYIVSQEKAGELSSILATNRNFGSKNITVYIIKNNNIVDTVNMLKEKRVRVITEYGILLPVDVINSLKMNAVFTMNKEAKLNCLRSK